jgi:hypothetical protein
LSAFLRGQFTRSATAATALRGSSISTRLQAGRITCGTIDSQSTAGTTITLPDTGTYRIEVAGTWNNNSWGPVDAEYASYLGTYYDGFDHASTGIMLGADFGDLQVNNTFVNWGAYNTGHVYSTTTAATDLSTNLRIFDGDGNTQTLMPSWYGDNSGTLNYTITYVGPQRARHPLRRAIVPVAQDKRGRVASPPFVRAGAPPDETAVPAVDTRPPDLEGRSVRRQRRGRARSPSGTGG